MIVERCDAEEFLLSKGISNHPHIQDSVTGGNDYEVADLMVEFANAIIGVEAKSDSSNGLVSGGEQCEGGPQNAELSELYKMIGYSGMIRDLIRCAETEEQRGKLDLLVGLFKNRFKRQSMLITYVNDICMDINELRNTLL